MSRRTTLFSSLIRTRVLLGAIALATTPTAPALAATTDPLQLIYLFPGVADNGAANFAGLATAVHCFSFSTTNENVQFVVRTFDGSLVGNQTQTIPYLGTRTAVTHGIAAYASVNMATGLVIQGTLGVSATSTNVVCTAQVVDAAAVVPNGYALHPVRFNSISGTQE